MALGVRDERAPGPRRLGSGAPRPQARSRGVWRQLGLSAVSLRERSAWLLRARGKRPFRSQRGGRPPFPGLAVSARGWGPCAARPPSCSRRRAAGEAALLGAGPWPAAACPSRAWRPHVHIAARLVPAQGVCGARTALETLHFNEIPSTRGCFPARLPCGSSSSGEWQVGGRSLVQGHPPVGCRPRGEGMSVGVSAGHDGAVKGGPQRSAWPVLPRRPRVAICVWVSLGTG